MVFRSPSQGPISTRWLEGTAFGVQHPSSGRVDADYQAKLSAVSKLAGLINSSLLASEVLPLS